MIGQTCWYRTARYIKKLSIVIIGASLTGLTAVNKLIKDGFRPLVLEYLNKARRIACAENYKGYCFFTKVSPVKR